MHDGMKIGVMTFWQTADNYGQVLQCWALQKYLLDRGQKPFLIRYDLVSQRPSKLQMIFQYGVFKALKDKIFHSSEVERKKILRRENAERNVKRNFDAFREEHLIMSDKVWHSLSELKTDPPVCDVLLTGSDQVWALPLSEEKSHAFFLNFGQKSIRRASYAASFSKLEYPERDLPKLKALLSGLDAISVRESSSLNILEKAGYEGRVVLDPTMMLRFSDYRELMPKAEVLEKPYLYIYSINISSPEDMDWMNLSRFALNHGFAIRSTFGTGYIPGDELFDTIAPAGVKYDYPEVGEWLRSMSEASVVATTSFHGVVFSILARRPFVYYPLKGMYSAGNVRVLDLLSKLDLDVCVWRPGFDYEAVLKIAWDGVGERLEVLRGESRDFLKGVLDH